MDKAQKIKIINECITEQAAGAAVRGAAKSPFLQQLLIMLGLQAASSFMSGSPPKDAPMQRSASVNLPGSGSGVTPAERPRNSDYGKPRRFATLRGKPIYPD